MFAGLVVSMHRCVPAIYIALRIQQRIFPAGSNPLPAAEPALATESLPADNSPSASEIPSTTRGQQEEEESARHGNAQ